MPRIRHTRDRERHYRFNGVEFEEGERERDVDEETAEQATAHEDVEYVDREEVLEDLDYAALQERAKDADIPANQSREELVDALEEEAGDVESADEE